MKSQRVAALGGARPRRGLAGEGDLVAAEASLVADHGAGAGLALQAMAQEMRNGSPSIVREAARSCRRRAGWSWVGSVDEGAL
jgi:hypothetical protein